MKIVATFIAVVWAGSLLTTVAAEAQQVNPNKDPCLRPELTIRKASFDLKRIDRRLVKLEEKYTKTTNIIIAERDSDGRLVELKKRLDILKERLLQASHERAIRRVTRQKDTVEKMINDRIKSYDNRLAIALRIFSNGKSRLEKNSDILLAQLAAAEACSTDADSTGD